MDAGRHSLDQGCHISITALGLYQYSSTFALRSSSAHDKICQDSVFVYCIECFVDALKMYKELNWIADYVTWGL